VGEGVPAGAVSGMVVLMTGSGEVISTAGAFDKGGSDWMTDVTGSIED